MASAVELIWAVLLTHTICLFQREGLEGHGTVDNGGFPGLTANPQHMFGPPWSVRLSGAPLNVGQAVFLGLRPCGE